MHDYLMHHLSVVGHMNVQGALSITLGRLNLKHFLAFYLRKYYILVFLTVSAVPEL